MTLAGYVAEHGHHKYDRYFPVFDLALAPFYAEPIRLLEIGCSADSLAMWRDCFPQAEIVGLDICPRGATNTDDLPSLEGVTFIEGDQTDVALLGELGVFDVVDDDAGHIPLDQILTFQMLFPLMPRGSWYFIEDLHTSYYGEGYGEESAVDFLKELLDDLQVPSVHSRASEWPIAEMRFVDSLVAIRHS